MEKTKVQGRLRSRPYFRYDVLFILLLLCGIGLYIYRLPFGMADVDETFYLSIPYRLCQGDALIVDEWHVSQLAGFLLYPIMWVYLKIVGTTEGIVLAFRCIYVVFQLLAATGIYCILRRFRLAAAGAAALFFIFSPFDIMALSYNSMGLAFTVLFSLLLFAVRRPNAITYVLAGICCACSVLCNPYFAVLYILYLLSCCVSFFIQRRRGREIPPYFRLKSALWMTAGAAVVALLFLILLFSRASLSEVLQNLPHVLSDPAHPAKTFNMIVGPIEKFIAQYMGFTFPAASLLLLACIDKNEKRCGAYLLATILLSMGTAIYFALYQTAGLGMNAVMLPLSAIGLCAYASTSREHRKPMMLLGWLVGALYAVCMVLSSNQYMYVVSNALVVSDIFTLLMLSQYCRHSALLKSPALKIIPLLAVLVLQLSAQTYVKTNHVFWDQPVAQLTSTVPSGPVKGIRTTKAKSDTHMNRLSDLTLYFSGAEGEVVHFFRNMPYAYLYTGTRPGTFSAWGGDNRTLTSQKLEEYYALHPDKIPERIYVDALVAAKSTPDVWQSYAQTHGYTLEALPSGALLYTKI